MAVKDIIKMGNPILRKISEPVSLEETKSAEFTNLLQDMDDTMNSLGGIGIAAPQIGVNKQVCIVDLPIESERYPETQESERYIILNPKIEVLDDELQGFWEGCLSVPTLRGYVERPRKVRVSYKDEKFEDQIIEPEDFLATVFQHELDHLFGKLYVDHIKDTKLLMFEDEFVKLAESSQVDEDEILD